MKKIIFLLLLISVIFCICLISCDGKDKESSTDTTTADDTAADVKTSNETLKVGDENGTDPSIDFGDLLN